MLLEQLIDLHLDINSHSKDTYTSYKRIIRTFIKDTGIKTTDDLGAASMDEFKRWRSLILSRASGSTFNTYKRHLRALANTAIREGLCLENPFKELRQARERHKPKIVAEFGLESVIRKINTESIIKYPEFWICLINFIYLTGVRRRQLIGVRWRDIDMFGMRIYLRSKYNKSKKGQWIPMHPDVVSILQTLRSMIHYDGEEDQVFNITKINIDYQSDKLTVDQITRAFRKISKKTGTRISAHRLRHTMATEIAENLSLSGEVTIGILNLSNLLTHSSITPTMVYLHPSIDSQRSVLTKLKSIKQST